ncbi:MAG: acyltransferase domain-containing protein [Actinobacteria bacterium]|nr:acyltransferase domain-containing protein [Actinomycetota bacterium]
MTPDGLDTAGLREWLVEFLVTTVGCAPGEVDCDASLNDLGVGSRDAVVLSGELAELLGRPVSPVELWQHPTVNALAEFLSGTANDAVVESVDFAGDHDGEGPIAVIGVGCRFPGGITGPESLWEFLNAGDCAVSTVPPSRWEPFDDGSPEVAAALAETTRWGGFLDDVAGFDADFFEISPREAATMDPQQRLLLEVAWEALEHAGIAPDALRRSQTGVFAGAGAAEYGFVAASHVDGVDAWSNTGGALSIVANRLSYFLDLRGPSVTVDTACSSSLVAIHLACQSLRAGDSDLALAAGVNLLMSPAIFRSFDGAGALSPSGRCHAFDAAADGFVRGEGAGVVVLKRLADAVRDGDRVLAVVRGSAVNQDGRSNGLMAPNPAAQMAVLAAAYAHAGVTPHEVDYVETHGTGTLLGDPIEARALGTVLGRGRRPDSPLLLGAVKSNLGHLEAAAGIAGFIKATLAVAEGAIPANHGYRNPNPHIPFDQLRLQVVSENRRWPDHSRPRLAGVSSFGFGGTNAHVVLEEAPTAPALVRLPAAPVTTLVVSGKTEARIAATAAALADWMAGAGARATLPDIAHTLNHHRARYPRFATVAATDRAQALTGLRALAGGYTADGVVPAHDGPCGPGTVFVYSGQGSQWTGMARRLLADEPAFADAVERLDPDFQDIAGFSLHRVIADGAPVTGINRIQPVLVGVQLALTDLWRSHGIHPDAVIGHSMGEVTAAVVAGALTVADGLRVITTRSALMARLSGQGAMALLELDPDATAELIAGHPEVTLAVFASPRQTVIAGPPQLVDELCAAVQARGRLARRVDVDVASHHPTIDPILPDLRTALDDLRPQQPTIPIISTVYDAATPAAAYDAAHWVDNLRNPVRFHQAITAAAASHTTFVEVSPHPLLTHAIEDTLAGTHHHTIATLVRDTHEAHTFHTHLNTAHAVGTPRHPHTPHPPEPHPALPATPWRHTDHWHTIEKARPATGSAPRRATLLGAHTTVTTQEPIHLWQAKLVSGSLPYPGHHRLHGVEVVPASVLINTLAAAAAELGDTRLCAIRLENPVLLDAPRTIQVVADRDTLTLTSRPADDGTAAHWVRHLTARRDTGAVPAHPAPLDTTPVHPVTARYDTAQLDELLTASGVDGRPFAWTLDICEASPTQMAATVAAPAGESLTAALLDAALHLAPLTGATESRLFVPAGLGDLVVTAEPTGQRGSVTIRRTGGDADEMVLDVTVSDADGTACVSMHALRYRALDPSTPQTSSTTADPTTFVHALQWASRGDADTVAAGRGSVAVLGAAGELPTALQNLGHPADPPATARHVVYVAGTGRPAGEAHADTAARLAAEVIGLVRELSQRDSADPARLWVLTRGVREGADDTALRHSPLWGLAGVIAAEHPDVWGGLIDLDTATDPAAAGRTLTETFDRPSKTVLALRDGQLLAPTLAPLTGAPIREPLRCRADAAYLITGGLGALGLLTAGWLADRGARRLLLAGRTPLPPRRDWDSPHAGAAAAAKIAAIRALEHRGVAVDVLPMDIGSAGQLTDMLDRRDRAGAPPIRGVIHAAGVTGDQLLTAATDDVMAQVLRPKIGGAEALHEAFPPGSVDFFYLTASAGALFGVPGQGSYAAANAYLDALARARHRQGCHTVSLDWVAWHNLGFAAGADLVVEELARMGSRPLQPGEAFLAWDHAQRHDIAQAVVMPTQQHDDADSATPDTPGETTDWSALGPEALRAELEAGLRAIVAAELRLPESELPSDRPFAELGLNSIMALSIRRGAEKLVGIELSATMLWNHPTVALLAAHLATVLSPPDTAETDGDYALPEPATSVLDSLFDSVESASGTESRI